jgi:hypothetical protein
MNMPRERPVAVLVFAILNIVFGTLSAIGLLCTGLALSLVYGFFGSSDSVLAGQSTLHVPPPPSDAVTAIIVEFGIQFVLSIALVVSGIGLLRMKVWARKLCIVLCTVGILLPLLIAPIRILYVNPRMEKWQEALQQMVHDQQKNAPQQPKIFFQQHHPSPALNIVSVLIKPILILTYAIILLIFMLRPQVSAAFAGRSIHEPTDWDRGSGEGIDN